MCMLHNGSVGGDILSPRPRVDGAITQCEVLVGRTGVCRVGGALARRLFAQPSLYVIYRLKERGAVVEIAEEIGVRVRAHDRASDDAAGGSDGCQGRDAVDGERRPTDDLAKDDYGEGADDASGDRVVTLWAGKEIDGGVKVVLSDETIFELWTEELLCAGAGIEG